VLRPVDFVFRFIPFDPHLCLQYSTYACVKSSGEMPYQGFSLPDGCGRPHVAPGYNAVSP
jgi:hypothetical protein